MTVTRRQKTFCDSKNGSSWTFYFLSYFVCLTTCSFFTLVSSRESSSNCPHPSVPFAAKYINVTGGPDQPDWKIKYSCDSGYVLFGEPERICADGKWKKNVPQCAVNVAKYKPASSSSEAKGGEARKAVDGKTSTVHEGDKCTETEAEKSPWWTVDLLDAYPVHFVRLTTRCCDGITVKKAEVRVGNSTTHSDNPLCDWIPKELPEMGAAVAGKDTGEKHPMELDVGEDTQAPLELQAGIAPPTCAPAPAHPFSSMNFPSRPARPTHHPSP